VSDFNIGDRVLVKDDCLVEPWPGTVTNERNGLVGWFGVALDDGARAVLESDEEFLGDWIVFPEELEHLDE